MLKTARERVEKLFKAGKSEAEVVSETIKGSRRECRKLRAAINFLKMVYNSFKRS
jgi:hypothetical protein